MNDLEILQGIFAKVGLEFRNLSNSDLHFIELCDCEFETPRTRDNMAEQCDLDFKFDSDGNLVSVIVS